MSSITTSQGGTYHRSGIGKTLYPKGLKGIKGKLERLAAPSWPPYFFILFRTELSPKNLMALIKECAVRQRSDSPLQTFHDGYPRTYES